MTPIRFEKHSKSWPWVSIDRWIIGHQGVLLFTLSALCSLALTPIFLGWIHPARMSYSLRIFWAALEILGPIGLVLIYFGMWLYWYDSMARGFGRSGHGLSFCSWGHGTEVAFTVSSYICHRYSREKRRWKDNVLRNPPRLLGICFCRLFAHTFLDTYDTS